MKPQKTFRINKESIVAKNLRVNTRQLADNLKSLQNLEKAGINVRANYSLGSPYIRPQSQSEEENASKFAEISP